MASKESLFKEVKYYVTGVITDQTLRALEGGGAKKTAYLSGINSHCIVGSEPDMNLDNSIPSEEPATLESVLPTNEPNGSSDPSASSADPECSINDPVPSDSAIGPVPSDSAIDPVPSDSAIDLVPSDASIDPPQINIEGEAQP